MTKKAKALPIKNKLKKLNTAKLDVWGPSPLENNIAQDKLLEYFYGLKEKLNKSLDSDNMLEVRAAAYVIRSIYSKFSDEILGTDGKIIDKAINKLSDLEDNVEYHTEIEDIKSYIINTKDLKKLLNSTKEQLSGC